MVNVYPDVGPDPVVQYIANPALITTPAPDASQTSVVPTVPAAAAAPSVVIYGSVLSSPIIDQLC